MEISVPAYLPYKTVSPSFTVTGSSFLPGPAAITTPRCGFSLAVSGIMIPPAVFSSAAAAFTITRSCNGVTFTLLAITYLIYCFSEMMSKPAVSKRAKVNDYYATPSETEKISVFHSISLCRDFKERSFFQVLCQIFSNKAFQTLWAFEKVDHGCKD